MVINNKIKLESGKEVSYSELNWDQRAEIIDEYCEAYARKIPLSLVMCGKLLVYSKICNKKDLNEKKFKTDEVYEIGARLMDVLRLDEIEKKK